MARAAKQYLYRGKPQTLRQLAAIAVEVARARGHRAVSQNTLYKRLEKEGKGVQEAVETPAPSLSERGRRAARKPQCRFGVTPAELRR